MSEPDGAPPSSNEVSGRVTGPSVQAGAVYGDVIIGRTRRPLWSRPLVIIAAVLIIAPIAGVGAAWLGSSKDAPASEPNPLSVAVTVFASACQTTWVVPRPPEQIDLNAPAGGDWTTWGPAKDGVAASPGTVFATVQGRTEAEVVITDLRVRVHERHEPMTGTNLKGKCGDGGAFRWLQVDLDAQPPRTVPIFKQDDVPADAPEPEKKPISFPYEVSLRDAETFVIQANTAGCLCDWTAELVWASEGRTGTVTIDDHGRPFRTTALTNAVTCAPADLSAGLGKPVCS
jgi:hypothetical protein